MNYSFLQRTNKKNFEKTLNTQGQRVFNYSMGTDENVIFGKTRNGKTAQDRLSIFYSAGSSIKKGNIITYKNNYYIVMNENYAENDAWKNSTMIKCNTVWDLYGEKVPLIVSDLGSSSPQNGNIISTVGGTFSLQTSDIRLLHEKINIGDSFFDFGGVYKLVNKFFVEGLAFLYFQRGLLSLSEPIINRFDDNVASLNLNNGTAQLKYYIGYSTNDAAENKFYVPNAKIKYKVSDESVATIKNDGLLTMHKTGTLDVTVTATVVLENGGEYHEYNISREDTYEVANPSSSDVAWTITRDFPERVYVNGSSITFEIEPSKETDAEVTWKYYFDNEKYSETELEGCANIINDKYSVQVGIINSDLALYNFKVSAVIDGIETFFSNTSKVVIG